MTLETGTLAYVNFTAKVKDTGDVIDVTEEEESKKLGVHDPAKKYEPRLIAIGEGWILKGLEEALTSAKIGEKITVELPPEKGFGARDPNKVKMIPIRKFGEKASEISIGDEVTIDNKIGLIRFIGSGRAQVDFNHRLSGKTLIYNIGISRILETEEEKTIGLLKRRLPVDEKSLQIEFEKDVIKIQLSENIFLVEGLQIIKKAISNDLFKFLNNIVKVYFLELYESKRPKQIKTEVQAPVEEKSEEKKEEEKTQQ